MSGNREVKKYTFDEMMEIAKKMADSGAAGGRTIGEVIEVVQFGAEIGLTPAMSINSIIRIRSKANPKGKLSLPYRTVMSLVTTHPDYHWHTISSIEEMKETGVAVCEVRRRSWPEGMTAKKTFSVKEAVMAGNGEPGAASGNVWRSYYWDMLSKSAGTRMANEHFPDVMCGLEVAEIMESVVEQEKVARPRTTSSEGVWPKPEPEVKPEPEPESVDAAALIKMSPKEVDKACETPPTPEPPPAEPEPKIEEPGESGVKRAGRGGRKFRV